MPSPSSRELVAEAARLIAPDDSALQPWFDNYCGEHCQRIASDLDELLKLATPTTRFLEPGAAPYLLTGAMQQLDLNVTALDLQPDRFAGTISSLGLSVAQCDIERQPISAVDGSFDVVVFNELFEHLRIDPIFTLSEVHRVLALGGRLMLSTPNLRSFRGLRNLALRNQGHACSAGVYRQYEKLHTLGHMGHVREYTTREVSEFLQRVGFRVDEIIYRGGHGRGLVGLAERLVPALRPAFTLLATRSELPDQAANLV